MPIINRLPQFSWGDAKKVARVLANLSKRSSPSVQPTHGQEDFNQDSPHIKTPFIIPVFSKTFRKINRSSLARKYKQFCQEYDIDSPILLTTFPSTADFVAEANAGLKIYYCVDDWSNYPGLDHSRLSVMEQKLFQSVDAVVATSRILEEKKTENCPSLYLPQGVDFDHFHQIDYSNSSTVQLTSIQKPVVGFFGLISEWVDLGLIKYLSEQFPQVSFVMIGNAEVNTDSISDLPNIHLIGQVPYADLPQVASCFDIGIIPFELNELTKAVNPLKLMEYFAMGLPVVSTKLPDLEDVEGPLHLCSGMRDFQNAITTILEQDQVELSKQAESVARNNSWSQRAKTLGSFIEELLV